MEAKIERFALKQALPDVKKDSIVAYDLTDIAKDDVRKMEKLARVFDGSKRCGTRGYSLHGGGISSDLVRLKIHDGDRYTQNQQRRKIVEEIARKLRGKGIWVFDRGNDDKAFFIFGVKIKTSIYRSVKGKSAGCDTKNWGLFEYKRLTKLFSLLFYQ